MNRRRPPRAAARRNREGWTCPITLWRIEGLCAAGRMAQGEVSTRVLDCGRSDAEFLSRLRPELGPKRQPTAVIVSISSLASQTLRVFRTLGIRCPEDMPLLAFDEPEWADLVRPQLSVIRQPTQAIALTAWDILMSRMRKESGGGTACRIAGRGHFPRIGWAGATARIPKSDPLTPTAVPAHVWPAGAARDLAGTERTPRPDAGAKP